MDEKRKKGLCFWCDEKYDLGHVCQRKQLYKVEVWSDERDDENMDGAGEIEIEEEVVEEAHLSIHAMSGMTVPNFHTMKVHGRVGNKEFSILMDGGSSHNFIHPNMITKFGIRTQQLGKIAVALASGGRMMSSTYCKEFKWAMHGHEFVADAIVLPVKGYDMVLGVQWLSTLGDIIWNFNTLKMEFIYNNQRVVLRGASTNSLKLIGKSKMAKILHEPSKVKLAMLCLLQKAEDMDPVDVQCQYVEEDYLPMED